MPGFSMMMEMAEAGRWRKPEDRKPRFRESLDFRKLGFSDSWIFGFSDFGLQSKTEGLTQTEPNLDRDRFGPFFGTDGLGSVRSTDLRSVFGLP